jgi:hypothetical protein
MVVKFLAPFSRACTDLFSFVGVLDVVLCSGFVPSMTEGMPTAVQTAESLRETRTVVGHGRPISAPLRGVRISKSECARIVGVVGLALWNRVARSWPTQRSLELPSMRATPRWCQSMCRLTRLMTQAITVVIAPSPDGVRILAQASQKRLLQAILRPASALSMHAIPQLLEALANCHVAPLSVVLCADESGTGTLSEMFEVLTSAHTSEWPVGLAVIPRMHRCDGDCRDGFDEIGRLQPGGWS